MSSRTVGPASYGVLGLGAVSYAAFTFIWFTVPAFLSTLIRHLSLTPTEAGVVVGAVPLTYVPLGLFGGVAIDRIGSRRAIGISLFVFGVAQVARAFAGGFWTLLAPTLLLGVAGMGITFGLPKLVSELFPAERTGSATAVYQVGSMVGPILAFGLSRPVLGPLFGGWRQVFLLTGLGTLAYALVWVLAATAYGWSRAAGAGSTAGGSPSSADGPTSDDGRPLTLGSVRQDLERVLFHRELRLLVVVGTTYLFVNHGLRGWLTVLLEGRGLAPGLSGPVTSLFVVAQVVGILTIPPLADRWHRDRLMLVVSGVLCTVGTVGLLLAAGLVGIVAVSFVVGIGLGGVSTLIKVVPPKMDGIGPGLTATAVGFIYSVGEIGGFTGPFLVGALRDLTGSFQVGVGALVVAALLMALASVAMVEAA